MATTLRPGPVDTFDLVYLSPSYINRMKSILNTLPTSGLN
jgi:hypothetical protein